ncbi:MAG TPA: hypothetical protein VG389_07420, partial [Myxococcota bacterium]|nr:hypothetical protein [Myxococcota bacterium]
MPRIEPIAVVVTLVALAAGCGPGRPTDDCREVPGCMIKEWICGADGICYAPPGWYDSCARATAVSALLQTPCDPVGSTCNVSGSDSGVTVACAANQSPSDAGPSDPPGCCWLPCDPFAAESGCPP